MKDLKVLIINTTATELSGITSVILNYLMITKDIISYDFVLNGYVDAAISERISKDFGVVHIPPFARNRNPIVYMYWLCNFIKAKNFDIVHIHGNSGTLFFDVHAAYRAGIEKIIVHSHSSSCRYKVVHHLLKRAMNRELTEAIACSDLAGKWLFTKQFRIIPNGIDISKFSFNLEVRNAVRKEFQIDERSFVVGHVAKMVPVKNHTFLLRVFEEVLEQQPNTFLMLIGDGELRDTILESIRDMGLKDRVIMLGKRSDVERFYHAMDVFVLPSLFEGLPVTLIEAQASGLPCVVSKNITKQSDLTGTMEFVPIADDSIDAWVRSIIRLTNTATNRKQYADIIEQSSFNIRNCVDTLLKIYKNEDC